MLTRLHAQLRIEDNQERQARLSRNIDIKTAFLARLRGELEEQISGRRLPHGGEAD